MTGHSPAEDGFTLVEVLVSLAIIAIMLVYAIQAFFYFGKVEKQADVIAAQAEVDAAADLLRRELSGAVPVYRLDGQGRPVLHFNGEPDAIEFVTLSSGDRETGGLLRVRYRLEGNQELVSERRIFREHAEVELRRVVMLRNVAVLKFSYFDGLQRAEAWQKQNKLPNRISVDVVLGEGNTGRWPPTEVNVETSR